MTAGWGAPGAALQLTLDQLVAWHTQARGGKAAIEAVHSLEYELQIVEPDFQAEGLFRVDRQRRMRIDIYDQGERAFSEGFDGEHGWEWRRGAEHGQLADPQGEAALRHAVVSPVHILGVHELPGSGIGLEYLGRQDLEGTNYHALEVTFEGGFTSFYYLDPESWLIVRNRDFRAFHPDLDPEKRWHETRWSDFRQVEGQLRAFKSETVDLVTGRVAATVTATAIRVNPEIDPQIFEQP